MSIVYSLEREGNQTTIVRCEDTYPWDEDRWAKQAAMHELLGYEISPEDLTNGVDKVLDIYLFTGVDND